jgi:hypothetical protein
MKSVKVSWTGKKLRDIYPHASRWQVFKWKVGKFFRKVFISALILGAIYLAYIIYQEFNAVKYTAKTYESVCLTPGINQDLTTEEIDEYCSSFSKTTDNELERIMNEANFKAVTLLRARKVASDSKMSQENLKHEDIVSQEKTRHDSILAQIEAENEAIRAEELALVGTTNLK